MLVASVLSEQSIKCNQVLQPSKSCKESKALHISVGTEKSQNHPYRDAASAVGREAPLPILQLQNCCDRNASYDGALNSIAHPSHHTEQRHCSSENGAGFDPPQEERQLHNTSWRPAGHHLQALDTLAHGGQNLVVQLKGHLLFISALGDVLLKACVQNVVQGKNARPSQLLSHGSRLSIKVLNTPKKPSSPWCRRQLCWQADSSQPQLCMNLPARRDSMDICKPGCTPWIGKREAKYRVAEGEGLLGVHPDGCGVVMDNLGLHPSGLGAEPDEPIERDGAP